MLNRLRREDGAFALQVFSAIVAGKIDQCDRCGLTRTSPQFREAVWRLMARMGIVTEPVEEFLEAILEPEGERRTLMLSRIPRESQEEISLQVLCARIRHRTRDGQHCLSVGELEDLFVADVTGSSIPPVAVRGFVRRMCNAIIQEDRDATQLLRHARERARAIAPVPLPS